MTRLMVVLMAFVALGIACEVDTETGAQPTQRPATMATAASPTATPEPLILRGTGDDLTSAVDLREGLTTIVASHRGGGNFIVEIIPSAGGPSQLAFNEIGDYDGARAFPVSGEGLLSLSPGPYRIQVNADGGWAMTIQQRDRHQGKPPPVSFDSSGDNVFGSFLFRKGLYEITAEHSGTGNFIVEALKEDGTHGKLLVNDIGRYQGSFAFNIGGGLLDSPEGVYSIAVQADGSWSIAIE